MTVQDLANKCRELEQECWECPYKRQCDKFDDLVLDMSPRDLFLLFNRNVD